VLSVDAVSFHYVTAGQMFMFDFLLYRLNRHWTTLTAAAADRRHSFNSNTPHTANTTSTHAPWNSFRNQTLRR